MANERYVADCRTVPSEKNCSLRVSGTQSEVLDVTTKHAVDAHGHQLTPQLRDQIRQSLQRETDEGATQRNRELAHAIYDAYNRRDFAEIARHASAGALLTNVATGETFHGPDGMRTYAENWARAFPDSRVELQRITCGDEGYAVEFVASGTHSGPLTTAQGTVPATGRRLRMNFAELVTVRDGKIAEARAYFDALSMLTQLGLLPQRGVQPAAMAGSRTPAEQPETRRH